MTIAVVRLSCLNLSFRFSSFLYGIPDSGRTFNEKLEPHATAQPEPTAVSPSTERPVLEHVSNLARIILKFNSEIPANDRIKDTPRDVDHTPFCKRSL